MKTKFLKCIKLGSNPCEFEVGRIYEATDNENNNKLPEFVRGWDIRVPWESRPFFVCYKNSRRAKFEEVHVGKNANYEDLHTVTKLSDCKYLSPETKVALNRICGDWSDWHMQGGEITREEYKEIRSQLYNAEARNAALEHKLCDYETVERDRGTLSELVDSYIKKNSKLEETVKEKEANRILYKELYSTLSKNNGECRRKLDEARKEAEELRSEKVKLLDIIQSKEKSLHDWAIVNTENKELKEKVEKLIKEVKFLEGKNKVSDSEIQGLELRNAALENKLAQETQLRKEWAQAYTNVDAQSRLRIKNLKDGMKKLMDNDYRGII